MSILRPTKPSSTAAKRLASPWQEHSAKLMKKMDTNGTSLSSTTILAKRLEVPTRAIQTLRDRVQRHLQSLPKEKIGSSMMPGSSWSKIGRSD